MSLAELNAEYERQMAIPEERFSRPRDVLKYITDEKPVKEAKVTIDLDVHNVEEMELCWHVYMIDKSSTDDFEERKALIGKLKDRSEYVFCLTLWKAKKRSLDHVTGDDYIPGRSYVVNNVSGLQMYQGIAQGSVQARSLTKNDVDTGRGKAKRKAKEPKP